MQNTKVLIWMIGLQCLSGLAYAQSTTIKTLRYWTQSSEIRMVFDMTDVPPQNVTLLQNPARLVVNFENTRLHHKIGQPPASNVFLASIDSIDNGDNNLEVVFELKKNVTFNSFVLKSVRGMGPRLVVDIYETTPVTTVANSQSIRPELKAPTKIADKFASNIPAQAPMPVVPVKIAQSNASLNTQSSLPKEMGNEQKFDTPDFIRSKLISNAPDLNKKILSVNPVINQAKPLDSIANLKKQTEQIIVAEKNTETNFNKKITSKSAAPKSKEIIVAIDAGHGGEDSGAIGPSGTKEKQVVYKIAKKLESLIARQPGMTPVMVRDGDYFIKLRNRMQIARYAKANLFVSIHADAFANANARGSSVFTLSNSGASSEAARWLADNENAADLVGGVSLDDKDDMLASVLLDLSQTATTEASGSVAKKVLSNFRNINALHKSSVQKAGFMVLKSPDIPSILVETAFISNPTEEQNLRNDAHQMKVARAIFNGIVAYFKQEPIDFTPVRIAKTTSNAQNKSESVTRHSVGPGETLSGIAQQYGVTMRELKSANAMNTGLVRVGQVLRIPVDS